jgi:hypothetical protein
MNSFSCIADPDHSIPGANELVTKLTPPRDLSYFQSAEKAEKGHLRALRGSPPAVARGVVVVVERRPTAQGAVAVIV